eukprot:315115-Pyramimonas_sp.AAC.2
MPVFAAASSLPQSDNQTTSPEPARPEPKPWESSTSAAQGQEAGSALQGQPSLDGDEHSCESRVKPPIPLAIEESLCVEQRSAIGFVPSGARPLIRLSPSPWPFGLAPTIAISSAACTPRGRAPPSVPSQRFTCRPLLGV